MANMIFGVFENETNAEDAIEELKSAGYNAKDISIVMRNREDAVTLHDNTGTDVAGGAASGAVTGGIIGGIAGLLIGIGALAVPGIGALLIGGPLAAALGLTGAAATTVSGAATGALAGGLVGGLVNLGIPREDAEQYANRVKEGAILVAVPATIGSGRKARAILEDNGAETIKTLHVTDEVRGEEKLHIE